MSLVFLSGLTSAGCLEDYKKIIDGLYQEDSIERGSTVCKIWPATGNLIVAASIGRAENIDLDVQVYDLKSNSVIGRVRELSALNGDAIYSSGILIDTAEYRLDKTNLAFGIRILWKGSSQANPYSSESLRLYTTNGGELLSHLNGLTTYEYSGEWDTRCAGSFAKRKMTVNVMPLTELYADLVVKEKVEKIVYHETEGGCEDIRNEREMKTFILSYVQGRYVIPEELRTLAW
ncbi:hypothetical protein AABC73_02870 [Pseudomonas sp. G.S.17]|uniref:hypothetical protein n=1 Tax=Pseudomonas sp. G.S.17 TaxID=3137451 RepID=UPI00311C8D15